MQFLYYCILALMSVIPLAATDIYLPMFNAMSTSFNVTLTCMQLTVSIYILGLGIGQYVYGRLVDRIGFKIMFMTFMVLFIVGSTVCALSDNLTWFLLGRLCQALGATAALVSWQPLALTIFKGDQAKSVVSALFILVCISPGLAPYIGAKIAAIADWRYCFLLLATFGGVLLAASYFLKVNVGAFSREKRQLFFNKSFFSLLVLIASCYSGYLTFLVAYPVLATEAGLSSTNIGLHFVPFSLSFLFGVLFGKAFAKSKNDYQSIKLGVCIYTFSCVLLLASLNTQYLVVIMIAFCFLMFANGILLPLTSIRALSMAKNTMHSASGMIGSFRMLIAFVATAFITYLSSQSFSLLYCLTGLLALSAGITWICFYSAAKLGAIE